MKGMLEMEPTVRMTALEALADPYFDGLRDSETENLVKNMNIRNQGTTSQV